MSRFVIDARYVRSRPSGIGRYVSALIERLPALAPDDRFRLWTHPERPAPVTAPNVACVTVTATADGLRTLLAPTLLDRLAPDDLLHAPASLLGRAIPCPTVVTVHDLMWLERPELVDGRPLVRRARQRYYQAGLRGALARATRIIAVSHATADRIRAVSPESASRVVVTHNAAGPAFTPPPDPAVAERRAAEIVGGASPFYVVVGKNEPYKAHDLALAAFAAASLPDEVLVLVQRASLGRGLSRYAEALGVASRVRWIPAVSEADLVVLPTRLSTANFPQHELT